MSDFQTEPTDSPVDLPEPIIFKPGFDGPLPVQTAQGGSVVLLLVGAVDRRWAAQTAVELCTSWANRGRRVVLADMHLDDPDLHELLDVENMEGVVDIFLYGASISRSARPAGDRGFHLITAGTYEVDTSAIYRHPRWARLVAGFGDADATLVLYAPAAAVDLEAMSEYVSDVVLLGAPHTVPEPLARGVVTASGMLVPPGYQMPTRVEGRPESPRAVPIVDHTAEMTPAPVKRDAGSPMQRGVRVAITLVILSAVLAAAGFGLARYRPDLVPWLAPAGDSANPGAIAEPAAAAPPLRRSGDTVPFAVLVKSFASLSAAQRQVQVEQRRFADTPFYISPEDDSGVLYYKVYAGLLRDTASAERLRERLLQSGAVDSDDTLGALSLIHRAHLSFDLGEFASRDSAVLASDSLAAREIPAYAVPMPYEDGSRRWQLYGGAYRDSATADAMRQRLAGAGINPRLVLRVGEPAPGAE